MKVSFLDLIVLVLLYGSRGQTRRATYVLRYGYCTFFWSKYFWLADGASQPLQLRAPTTVSHGARAFDVDPRSCAGCCCSEWVGGSRCPHPVRMLPMTEPGGRWAALRNVPYSLPTSFSETSGTGVGELLDNRRLHLVRAHSTCPRNDANLFVFLVLPVQRCSGPASRLLAAIVRCSPRLASDLGVSPAKPGRSCGALSSMGTQSRAGGGLETLMVRTPPPRL